MENQQKPCPSCGHCPTCGRGGHYQIPAYPYFPTIPIWYYQPNVTYGLTGNTTTQFTVTS